MGFTPASGLVMGTRSGDLDPSLNAFLANAEGMTPQQFHRMVNQESGLLGVSETSADMRDLVAQRETDFPRLRRSTSSATVKSGIGAMSAAVGGLGTLVFSGGIGESAEVRRRAAKALNSWDRLDEGRNRSGEPMISTDASPTRVRVIRTDEETVIARETIRLGVQHT